jgi:Cdc6-like AAA superfamily ATPase
VQYPSLYTNFPDSKEMSFFSQVLLDSNEKTLLIEEASGSGKTVAAQELLFDISKSCKEGNCRGLLYYAPSSPVSNSKEFF